MLTEPEPLRCDVCGKTTEEIALDRPGHAHVMRGADGRVLCDAHRDAERYRPSLLSASPRPVRAVAPSDGERCDRCGVSKASLGVRVPGGDPMIRQDHASGQWLCYACSRGPQPT